MKNNISVCGASYEEIMLKAKAQSLTENYKGCRVFVNAHMVKLSKDENGQRFNVMFGTSDWYDTNATVGAWQDGEEQHV